MITTQQTCLSGNTCKLFLFQCVWKWSTRYSGLAPAARDRYFTKPDKRLEHVVGWFDSARKMVERLAEEDWAAHSLAQYKSRDGEDTTVPALLKAAFNYVFTVPSLVPRTRQQCGTYSPLCLMVVLLNQENGKRVW